MKKLYYEDQYKKNFTGEIINVIKKDDKFHIELDKTYFYPEGGGQPSDTGYIETLPITYVYENESHIYHVTEKKPIKIHKVNCSINWEKRFDHMQQHLGQHILSASFFKLFNGSTVGFHLGTTHCTIDVDKFLDMKQIEEAEQFANEIVLKKRPVEFLYPTNSELKKLSLRKIPSKTDEPIRIVKIEDFDINPCCGLHPNSTIEVQLIKITKWEKYKNSTRIEFLCGNRAVSDYFLKDKFTTKICTTLSSNESGVLSQIEKLTQEYKKVLSENKKLQSELANYEIKNMLNTCEEVNNIKIVRNIYKNEDIKQVNLIASKLTAFQNVIALFGIQGENLSHLLFMCSKDLKVINMNALLKDAITLIDGRGGGNEFSAQGGGKLNNNLNSALDYAYMKIMHCINNK